MTVSISGSAEVNRVCVGSIKLVPIGEITYFYGEELQNKPRRQTSATCYEK